MGINEKKPKTLIDYKWKNNFIRLNKEGVLGDFVLDLMEYVEKGTIPDYNEESPIQEKLIMCFEMMKPEQDSNIRNYIAKKEGSKLGGINRVRKEYGLKKLTQEEYRKCIEENIDPYTHNNNKNNYGYFDYDDLDENSGECDHNAFGSD